LTRGPDNGSKILARAHRALGFVSSPASIFTIVSSEMLLNSPRSIEPK
jgi:hypothetical protein